MKNQLLLLFLICIGSIFLFTDAKIKKDFDLKENDTCFIISKHEWGTACGSSNSLRVWFKNTCSQRKRISFRIQLADGSWERGSSTVRPGETTSFYVCHASKSGNIEWDDSDPY